MTIHDGEDPTQPLLLASACAYVEKLIAFCDVVCGRTTPAKYGAVTTLLTHVWEAGICDADAMVCAVSLMARVATSHPKSMSSIAARRTASACVLLATKSQSETQYAFALYATATRMSHETLRMAEMQTFVRLDFDAATKADDFAALKSALL